MNILIVAVPPLELSAPPQGPAVLKSVLKDAGHRCDVYDLNVKVWERYAEIDKGMYFQSWGMPFIQSLRTDEKDLAIKFYREELSSINYTNYDYLGISVLSYLQWESAEMVVDILRSLSDAPIIAGGPAIKAYDPDTAPTDLLQKVDHFITGDAEHSLVELLNGNLNYPGIDNFIPEQNFPRDIFPFPDYDDYDFSKYPNNWLQPTKPNSGPNNTLYISGSKGCVRNCNFCDVHKIWPTYLWKKPKYLVSELKSQKEKYNINHFYFTDSLLNGSNKILKEICEEIIEQIGVKKIGWSGQWICKSNKGLTEDHYKLAADAGLARMIVGVESGSENVRYHMRKKFKNEDLEFNLEQCRKHNIKFVPLMMCGYPTETEEDFQKSLDVLRLYSQYKDVIGELRCINMMYLIPGTDMIDRDFQDMIEADFEFASTDKRWAPEDQQRWQVGDNTYDVRIERFYRYQGLAKELGMAPRFLKKQSLLDDYLQCSPDPNKEIINLIKYVHN